MQKWVQMVLSILRTGTTQSSSTAKLILETNGGSDSRPNLACELSDRELDPWPAFERLETPSLVKLLKDPSLSVRQFSRQELWQRCRTSAEEVQEIGQSMGQRGPCRKAAREAVDVRSAGKPVSENLAEQLQAADPASRRTLLRSHWQQRQEMGEDAIPGLVQFMMKQTQHADARIRMEAVASLGQLDADQFPEAFDAVLEATSQAIDDNLDFAIWQSIRKLDQSFSAGSILEVLNWEEDRDNLDLLSRRSEPIRLPRSL